MWEAIGGFDRDWAPLFRLHNAKHGYPKPLADWREKVWGPLNYVLEACLSRGPVECACAVKLEDYGPAEFFGYLMGRRVYVSFEVLDG